MPHMAQSNPPQATTAQPAVLDTRHLADYTLGDAALERDVLEMFLEQLDRHVEALSRASSERQWRETAHSIKGSARGIGAFALGACAERLEKINQPFEALDKVALIGGMETDLEEIRAAITVHLRKGTQRRAD